MARRPLSHPARYARIPKDPARRYRDLQTGAIISRRQYTQRTKTGGKSLEKRAATRRVEGFTNPMERYSHLVRARQELEYYQTGKKRPLGEIRKDPEFKKLVNDLKSKSRAAKGPKARALVKLGLRDSTWTFAVGDTPKGAVSDIRLQKSLSEMDVSALEKMIRASERNRESRRRVNRKGRL
jgi:hypothetical protein